MSRSRLVVANWKMNGSLAANSQWVADFRSLSKEIKCDCAVCAPHVYLGQMRSLLDGMALELGAEDVSEYAVGAYTGETAASMLTDIGVRWVILGHSERRTLFGDTDQRVAQKASAAVAAGLRPIICIGETLYEREAGQTFNVVERQLSTVIDAIGVEALSNGAVAYEPVWAIGTGQTATPEMAQQVHSVLRELMTRYGTQAAQNTRILYGGSVKPANAAELFAMPDIDGGLIGGAALRAEDFYKICAA